MSPDPRRAALAALVVCAPSMGAIFGVQVPGQAGRSKASEAQLREGDRAWGGSVERNCELMNKNRIEGVANQGERASTMTHGPARPDVFLLPHFVVDWLRGLRGYFLRWLCADSAGCSLGRFSHWWRSVWVSVFGEVGLQTSCSLASTVLSGAKNAGPAR